MVAENSFVQVSGAVIGTGSHCVSMCMLVAMSGTNMFVPVELGDLK